MGNGARSPQTALKISSVMSDRLDKCTCQISFESHHTKIGITAGSSASATSDDTFGIMTHNFLWMISKDVTPLLMHWSYIFLALNHQYDNSKNSFNQITKFQTWQLKKYPLVLSTFVLFLSLLLPQLTWYCTWSQTTSNYHYWNHLSFH